jgi:hypothetical protein
MPRKSKSLLIEQALSSEEALKQASHSNHSNNPNNLSIQLPTLDKAKRTKLFEQSKQKNEQQDSNNSKKSGYLVSWNPLSKWPTIILIVILLIIIIAAIVIPIILLKPKSEEKVPDQSEQSRRLDQQASASGTTTTTTAPTSGTTTGPAYGPTPGSQSEVQILETLEKPDKSNITRVLFFTLEKLLPDSDKTACTPNCVYEKESTLNKRILINNIDDIYNINNKIINLVTPVNAKEAIITGIKIKNCKIILTRWPNSQIETKEYVQYMKDKPDDWLDIPFDINFPYYQTAVISIMSEILLFDINGNVIKDERIFEKDIIKEITFSIPFTSFKIRNCKVIVKQPNQIEESFEHRSNEDDTKDIKNDSKCYLKKSFTNTENNNYKTITIIPF